MRKLPLLLCGVALGAIVTAVATQPNPLLGGANAACHLDEHAAVLRSFGEVREILAGEGRPGLGQHLAGELLRWLPEHVHAMDAGVAASRSKQRFGGAPLVLHRKPKAAPG